MTKGRGQGRGFSRTGPKKRSAINRESMNNEETHKNKAKKGMNDYCASESSKKLPFNKDQTEKSKKTTEENDKSTEVELKKTEPLTKDKEKEGQVNKEELADKAQETTEDIGEDGKKEAGKITSVDSTKIPTGKGNLKITGLDTPSATPKKSRSQNAVIKKNTNQPHENEGYESEGSDTTPKRMSSYITRISVIFFVPPSENEADKKLFSAASKWMAKMEESDNKITLLPWYDSDMSEQPIKSFKDIPTALFMFKKYFTRGNPNEKGGKIYTDVKISHLKPIIEIKGDISWWLKKEKTDVFVNDIQSETTV